MKQLCWITILIVFSLNSFSQGNINPLKNKVIPNVTIKDIKGDPFKTENITNDGKPIIISFWATWCSPCKRELSAINDVYDEWVRETGVKLYAVSCDDARSTQQVEPLVNGKAWDFIVLRDPNGDFKRAMSVGPIPHTFLINGKGEIVWQHTTFAEGSELDLIELVRKLNRGEEIK